MDEMLGFLTMCTSLADWCDVVTNIHAFLDPVPPQIFNIIQIIFYFKRVRVVTYT